MEEKLKTAIIAAVDSSGADWGRVNLNIKREQYPTATVLHIRVKANKKTERGAANIDWSLKIRGVQAAIAALGWRECARWENRDEFYLRVCRSNRGQ